jgi:Glycyl-tRNA synthetase, beta subunit
MARKILQENLKKFFEENQILIKGKLNVFSTPNRLVVNIDKITKQISKKSEDIRGPNINSPNKALEGFLRSNNIKKNQIFKKKNEKGEFYFYKKPSQKINTADLLKENMPFILSKISWNKSMKWGDHILFWGRPLKSILCIFDGKILNFKFSHLKSSNITFIDKELEEKTKSFNSFKSYNYFFKSIGIIIDQEKRRSFILKEINKLSNKNKLKINLKKELLEEITNIVEKPKTLFCQFDKKYLMIPKEILIITMQNHQKYFPTFDKKDHLTNNFYCYTLIKKTKRGLIKFRK